MTSRMMSALTATIIATACGTADNPGTVAEAFWTASKNGDADLARTYIAESGSASINDESGSSIGDFTLGEATIDGEQATIATTIVSTDEQGTALDFNTVLVRQDDGWKVDLDETTSEMMRSLFGASLEGVAEQMGEALGEAMGEAMEGIAEGMAKGLESMRETLSDSLKATGR